MILPARPHLVGVTAELAGVMALALADYVRRNRITDPEVIALLEELRALALDSDRNPNGTHSADPPVEWSTINENTVAAYGVSDSMLRRRARNGDIPARRKGHQWVIPAQPWKGPAWLAPARPPY